MALQTSISNYFSNRKRPAGPDQGKRANKVLILEETGSDPCDTSPAHLKKISTPVAPPPQPTKTPGSAAPKASTTPKFSARKAPIKPSRPVRKSLFPTSQHPSSKSSTSVTQDNCESVDNPTDPIQANGSVLSPMKSKKQCNENENKNSTSSTDSSRKELGLSDIKVKLSRSSRLDEIRGALERLKQGHEKLNKIEQQKEKLESNKTTGEVRAALSKSPSLHQFKSIQLEVPTSPSKLILDNMKDLKSPSKLRDIVFKSPTKIPKLASSAYVSPRKLLEEKVHLSPLKSPPPAYQRYYSLAAAGKPVLVLPYKYRTLAEIFRSVDTVVSIMYNRNETVTFSKLRQPVQELSKKNLTEAYLGQILAVLPEAYKFSQEKVHQFGQTDKYNLVITPIFDSTVGNNPSSEAKNEVSSSNKKKNERELMTPSMLLERKRRFYEVLLDMAKQHHEEFLKGLDPPMVISRDKLTRWHPDFDIESCPEIKPSELPPPPNLEKYSTAKDVLNKARDMFVMNPRMEKALQRLTTSQTSNEQQVTTTSTAASCQSLANALKGIPKSLLEKVRARQAAKAMMLLTRDPEENKTSVELSRLPELARILRNLFVGEKKNVLTMDMVITKLCSSYREILSPSDMEHHLHLIIKNVPGWLTLISDKRNYLRMAKDKEMVKVMTTLQNLANKNSI